MKRLRYGMEALLLSVLLIIFGALPLDAASAAGGWLGRMIGPRLAASRKARTNLHDTLPDLTEGDRKRIIAGMWDNLGRVMAEYPHLEKIGRERVEVVYHGDTKQLLDAATPCLLISAHMANWEISAAALLARHGTPLDITYRPPNNPWADRLLIRARSLGGRIRCHPKSREGGQDLLRAMREGRTVGILIDQKYNEGIAVPFFGRPAMTNPVFASLAKKFGRPLIPARIERTGGAHFTVTLYDPIHLEGTTTEETIATAHACLEEWIRQRPEQWLWLHRRWNSRRLEQRTDEREAA